MKQLKLYRKRFIPNEIIELKDDLILREEKDLIITKWTCLKPRKDIAYGLSAYILNKGYKICKVYNHNNELVYWYCDIITSNYDQVSNSLVVTDLLIDILIYGDGTVNVVDLDEVALALERNLITVSEACLALRTANNLLHEIETGTFQTYQLYINEFDSCTLH